LEAYSLVWLDFSERDYDYSFRWFSKSLEMKMDRFFDVDDRDTGEIYPEKNHFKRAFYIFNKAMTIFNNILNDNHPATT
jgi:hypothetical protein